MIQAIDHYISTLTERGELDAIVRNILVSRGDEVIKQAFRGEKELGVDIASLRREQDGTHLYLFQVKAGDLDRVQWDNGTPNSVRQSLNEAMDAEYTSFSKLKTPPVRRHLIVVFNGELKADVREQYEHFVKREMARIPGLEITHWSQSTLIGLVSKFLINEAIFPTIDALKVKKALAFADTPEYGFLEYAQLLEAILAAVKLNSPKLTKRSLAGYRMVTQMIAHYAVLGGNYKNAVLCHELALLKLAHWRQLQGLSKKPFRDATAALLGDYGDALVAFLTRYLPAMKKEDGLFLGGLSELYEFPFRCFELLGMAAVASLVLTRLGREKDARVADGALRYLIVNQAGSQRPMIDGHGIDIALAALALAGRYDRGLLTQLLTSVLNNLILRKNLRQPLPEYLNNVDAVIEYYATSRKPEWFDDTTSTLLWTVLELSLLGDGQEDFVQEARDVLKQVKYDLWYPPAAYPDLIFHEAITSGQMETDIRVPQDSEALFQHVMQRFQEVEKSVLVNTLLLEELSTVLFVAFRHWRTPVFPQLWRSLILAGTCD